MPKIIWNSEFILYEKPLAPELRVILHKTQLQVAYSIIEGIGEHWVKESG